MGHRSCAAIVHNGSILMVRQTYKGNTFWTFPGGGIEQWETPEECAIRETREETGVEIELTNKACEFFSDKINGTYSCYIGRMIGGSAQLGSDPERSPDAQELLEVKWFPFAEMKNHPEVKRILPYLRLHRPSD